MPGFVDQTVTYKIEALGQIDHLDLRGVLPIIGVPTPSQKGVRQMLKVGT
jgi:hypothetical protein